jgi:hypothetical protein
VAGVFENTGVPPFDSFEAYPGNGGGESDRIRAIFIMRILAAPLFFPDLISACAYRFPQARKGRPQRGGRV